MELQRAFTQFQLVLLILIVYWVLETNCESGFRWALRSYVIGMIGSGGLAAKPGQTDRARAGGAFTLLSPLLFVRQVLHRPIRAALLLAIILVVSVAAGFLAKEQGPASSVAPRP